MKSKKQTGRKKSIILLVIISILILASSFLTFVPFESGIKDYVPVVNNISLGIDLKGGVYVVMEADNKDEDGNVIEKAVFDRTVDGTISVLTNRLVGKGFTEATVVKQGENRLRIEIPDVDDPEQVFNIIGKPAVLEFRDESGNVLLTGGKHLQSAFTTYDEDGKPAVGLTLNAEGTTLFAKATQDNLNKTISIFIDEDEVSKPTVNSVIENGKPIITNIGTVAEADDFAMLLQSGSLPLVLTDIEKGSISPTLGQDALRGGIIAGIIGLILVMIFMSVYYRGLGLISSICLVIYTLLLLYVIAGMPVAFSLAIIPQVQMTLPGIAGIILSIGMAIDANIIIFERIKDEYKLGKSIETSVKAGFKRATSAILDSNITTMFAGIVLMFLGTGSIKGFANVLIIGILVSVFSALIITRFLLKIFLRLVAKGSFYGLKREDEIVDRGIFKKEFTVVQHKKKYFTVSLSVIFIGLLMMAIFGLNLGIDFTGGNIISVQIGTDLNEASAENSNYHIFVDNINQSIDSFATEKGLTIDKSTPQMVGSSSDKGITLRYNIKNSLPEQELSDRNDELNKLISDNIEAKMAEIGILDTNNYKYDTTTVGGTVSNELVSSAFWSVAVAAVLILIYLAFRFHFLMGAAAVIALIHDVLIMVAFVSIFRYQINSSFIAAMITIIGYSINATIVIFDRVRENLKRLSLRDASLEEIGNKSIKETIMRSINTTITTLTTILVLFVVGVPAVKEFAFPIIVGLLAGTYSSVFLSVPIWVMIKNRYEKFKLSRKSDKSANPVKKAVKAN